jgi:hypothetical protein
MEWPIRADSLTKAVMEPPIRAERSSAIRSLGCESEGCAGWARCPCHNGVESVTFSTLPAHPKLRAAWGVTLPGGSFLSSIAGRCGEKTHLERILTFCLQNVRTRDFQIPVPSAGCTTRGNQMMVPGFRKYTSPLPNFCPCRPARKEIHIPASNGNGILKISGSRLWWPFGC